MCASMLRTAADEVSQARAGVNFAHVRSRLSEKDARRLANRLDKLVKDFQAAEQRNGDGSGDLYSFVNAFWSPDGANPK
jgi:hypothetical protein